MDDETDETKPPKLRLAESFDIDLIGPFQCESCGFRFSMDADYLTEHGVVDVVCPSCETEAVVPASLVSADITLRVWCSNCGPKIQHREMWAPDAKFLTALIFLDQQLDFAGRGVSGFVTARCSRCKVEAPITMRQAVSLMMDMTGSQHLSALIHWVQQQIAQAAIDQN